MLLYNFGSIKLINMTQNIKQFLEDKKITMFQFYLIIEFIIVILSIVIPHSLILLNHRFSGCGHHSGGQDGDLWEWGRALGLTALIWFIISSFQGFTMNKHARLFHKKRKARDLHCVSSLLCILFVLLHLYYLFISEPWRSILLLRDREHFTYRIFQFKIGTGVYFAIIMILVSILSFAARDVKFMKKIGYKRFRIIHWIMMVSTVILIIHIFYINTEIWIMTGYRIR